VIACIS